MLAQKPDFGPPGRSLMDKWFDPELAGHLLEGLAEAGLEAGDNLR